MKPIFSVPGYPPFFASRVFSSIAVWVDFTLIFSLLSFDFNATPKTLGLAAALYGLPGLFLGPFVGFIADQSSPALVMLLSSGGRFMTSILLAVAPTEQIFVGAILLKGISNLGAMPAEQILIRHILSAEQIVSTTTLTSIVDQAMKIVSPLVGAGLAFISNSKAAFLFTAALALASATCAVRIAKVVGWKTKVNEAKNRLPNFTVLWRLLSNKPKFAVSLVSVLSLSITLGLYDSLLVILLREHGLPASAFGTIVSCTAAGAIACAVFLKRLLGRLSESCVMSVSMFGFCFTVVTAGVLAAMYAQLALLPLCAIWLFNGFFYAGGVMVYSISLQNESPREMLGVLSSTCRSLQLAALVIGPVVGSWVAQRFGTQWTFIGAGGIGLFIAIASVMVNRMKSIRPEVR
jgi:MFS family permease